MSEKTKKQSLADIPNAPIADDGTIAVPLLLKVGEVLFPNTVDPVAIKYDEPYNHVVADYALEQQRTVIHANVPNGFRPGNLMAQVEPIATECAMVDMSDERNKMRVLMVEGRRRVQILSVDDSGEMVMATARILEETIETESNLYVWHEEVMHLFAELLERSRFIPEEIENIIYAMEEDLSVQCDNIASVLPIPARERQQLLNELRLDVRYRMMYEFMDYELGALDVRDDINEQVQDELMSVQREIYLREQLRVIQEQLGEGDFFEEDLESLQERIDAANLPPDAHTQALRELKRLAIMQPMSSEAGVIRTYLDWILDIPWTEASKDNLNLRHAEKVLNRQHYGLEKVKERVLEHIAVRKLAGGDMRTPIICFVGPPGVGKTSLGKSIAEALGREFVRVSLGGVRDEAEIRGHRRTYIGALPGRIINTMKRAGTVNPVFMLDEIDKMTEDYRGDPASALLEVLDPEQNNEFYDHYMEIPYDLSQVLFIATANELYPLPEALEDRMEIIEFRAYTEEEKLEIAKRFLLPKQLKAHGLSRRGVSFLDTAIKYIIHHYTLEAGVRNLERELANVCRKITRLAAMKKKYPKRITANIVEKYLGAPYIIDSHLNREDNIGIITGLVWTAGGGDTQIIEASLLPGKGNLTLTGQLGDVLQESAQIALNYMRSRADDYDVPHDDFDNYDVHIHLPEGSVPKDGPSAGITLAVAIMSIFTESKIRSNVAMTGEVTLRGHVLPVGGVKEKVLAARRRGITHVILPADNEKDLIDVPKKALKDMQISFVRDMQSVLNLVIYDTPDERQRDLLENIEEIDDEA